MTRSKGCVFGQYISADEKWILSRWKILPILIVLAVVCVRADILGKPFVLFFSSERTKIYSNRPNR